MDNFIQCKLNISDNFYNFECNNTTYSYYLTKNKYPVLNNTFLFPIINKINAKEFAINQLEKDLNQKVIINK